MKLDSSYKFEKNDIRIVNWFHYFSVACYSMAIIDSITGGKYYSNIMLMPFVHYPIFALIVMFKTNFQPEKSSNDHYISSNYPDIWEKLSIKSLIDYKGRFEKGMYDNGEDKLLNEIKYRQSLQQKLVIKSFILIFKVWVFVGILAFIRTLIP